MATVHPSRMALVPRDPPPHKRDEPRRRSPSPRRTPSPSRDRDRERDRQRNARNSDSRGRRRSYSRSRSPRRGDRDKDRDRERDRNDNRRSDRRRSPEYGDYRRPSPGPDSQAPLKSQENMYPNRRGDYGRGGAGADFLESRRLQRESATANPWPPSPPAPTRTLSPRRSKPHKSSRRTRSPSSGDDSDSEEDRRRKERKERKRARKEKDRKEKREKRTSRKKSYDDDSDDDRDRQRRRTRTPAQSKSPTRSESRKPPSPSRTPTPAEHSGDEWVVKDVTNPPIPAAADPIAAYIPHDNPMDEDSDDEVGPQPAMKINKKIDERAYGGALLRGEGSAMAAFLQDGTDSRIPRRGEIGLTPDQIAEFEGVGYVMSGSRHRRMNAVRMRKENQVISAEEKRGILKLQKEERSRRETILREEFSELVSEKLKSDTRPT
ncbi:DUF926-domain-containing protein [Pluteus cervinus]|uniref:DUF926-domain-containing protein n=1 Tax=Pluteus cervinus TaxID=181527 RepID=A0ACD3AZ37_9AGAR|nr:DUF926-domain-containing protein [Pluteus cervinus]